MITYQLPSYFSYKYWAWELNAFYWKLSALAMLNMFYTNSFNLNNLIVIINVCDIIKLALCEHLRIVKRNKSLQFKMPVSALYVIKNAIFCWLCFHLYVKMNICKIQTKSYQQLTVIKQCFASSNSTSAINLHQRISWNPNWFFNRKFTRVSRHCIDEIAWTIVPHCQSQFLWVGVGEL